MRFSHFCHVNFIFIFCYTQSHYCCCCSCCSWCCCCCCFYLMRTQDTKYASFSVTHAYKVSARYTSALNDMKVALLCWCRETKGGTGEGSRLDLDLQWRSCGSGCCCACGRAETETKTEAEAEQERECDCQSECDCELDTQKPSSSSSSRNCLLCHYISKTKTRGGGGDCLLCSLPPSPRSFSPQCWYGKKKRSEIK